MVSVVYTVLFFALILGGLVSALLNSENGSRFAVSQTISRVNQIPGLNIGYSESTGTLLRGLGFRNLEVNYQGNLISVAQAGAGWNLLTLVNRSVDISSLDIDGLVVRWQAAESGTGDQAGQPPVVPELPLPLRIDQLTLTNAIIQFGDLGLELDRLSLAAELDRKQLALQDLELRSPMLVLDGDLGISLDGYFPLDARLDWEYQGDGLTGISETWQEASGRVELGGDLNDLQIANQLDLPLSIATSGNLFIGLFSPPGTGLRFSLEHLAPALRLPFSGMDNMGFSDVRLQTSGQVAAINMQLDATMTEGVVPGLRLAANGQLRLEQSDLRLFELSLVSDTGNVNGRGELNWQSGVEGDFELQLQDSSPLSYLAGAPPMDLQNLLGDVAVLFSNADGEFVASIGVRDLAATLDGYDLNGSGSLQWQPGNLQLDDVRLATVNNQLFIDGQIGEEMDLRWQVEAPALDQVLLNAGGALQASGRLGGSTGVPLVEATIRGENLRYGDSMPPIRNLALVLSGTRASHRLQGALDSDLLALQLAARGGFLNEQWQEWAGSLDRADLDSDYGKWIMVEPTDLTVSAQSVDFRNSCWSFMATRICLDVTGDPSESIDISGSLVGFSLGLLNADDPMRNNESGAGLAALPALPENVVLQGILDVNATARIRPGQGYSVEAEAQGSGAGLSIRSVAPDPELDDVETTNVQFYAFEQLSLSGAGGSNGWELRGDVDFVRSDVDDTLLSLRGALQSQLSIGADQSLGGRIELQFEDLGWLEALVPDLDSAAGRMEGEAFLTGSLTQPRLLNVDISVTDAAANIDALGISLEQVNLSVVTADRDTLRLQVSAVSGPGTLQINGSIADPWLTRRELQLSVAGQDFQLINNPDLHLHVSPELELIASRLLIDLRGRLHLPTLDLRLNALPETAVDVSRDTVIVNYPPDRPELGRTIAQDQGMFMDVPVASNLTVSLGDNVRFEGFGLRAGLSGELNIQLEVSGASRTYGELSVRDGVYNAYSTELELEQGKLLFFGAYDNPALDIRAVRKMDQITAGVQMNGTLKNINSQLYSSPALPDNDIIAVLITGKPFSQVGEQDSSALLGAVASLGLDRSQGLTNQIRDQLGLDTLAVENTSDINNSMLTIGKYLSPSLFVRYGVGLFDQQSTVALDYKLTETITLQAESGDSQSLDLTYRIER